MLVLLGRGLLGLYFIVPGITKVTGFAATSEYMASKSVPMIPILLVVTIIIQIGGGLSLVAGYRTQLVAFVLAGLTLVISLSMHDFWNVETEMQNFIKNMAIMAGLLYVAGVKPMLK